MIDVNLVESYAKLLELYSSEWSDQLVEIRWMIGDLIVNHSVYSKEESNRRLGIIQGVLWATGVIANPVTVNRKPPSGDPKEPIKDITFTSDVIFEADVLFKGNITILGTLTTIATEIIDNEEEWRNEHEDPTVI